MAKDAMILAGAANLVRKLGIAVVFTLHIASAWLRRMFCGDHGNSFVGELSKLNDHLREDIGLTREHIRKLDRHGRYWKKPSDQAD